MLFNGKKTKTHVEVFSSSSSFLQFLHGEDKHKSENQTFSRSHGWKYGENIFSRQQNIHSEFLFLFWEWSHAYNLWGCSEYFLESFLNDLITRHKTIFFISPGNSLK